MATEKITYICANCLKQFVPKYEHNINKFCSVSCRYEISVKNLAPRFWEKVEKTDTCWLWTGQISSNGYGEITSKRKHIRAHRLAYELAFGEIPVGLLVCHKCDIRNCVRPDHLFLGTSQDNAIDRTQKSRNPQIPTERRRSYAPRGEAVKQGKLTEKEVLEIRKAYVPNKHGNSKTALAKRYGVSREAIKNILNGKSWKHLE